MLLVFARADFLGSESLGTRDHILLSQLWDFAFRRLLRHGGGIRSRLRTGYWLLLRTVSLSLRGTDHAAQKTERLTVVEACYHAVAQQTVSARTTKKRLSFLSRIVIATCLLVRYPTMNYSPRICLRGNAFIEPLPSSGSVRHSIIKLQHPVALRRSDFAFPFFSV
jgi:hypothetical protein